MFRQEGQALVGARPPHAAAAAVHSLHFKDGGQLRTRTEVLQEALVHLQREVVQFDGVALLSACKKSIKRAANSHGNVP